MAEALLDEIGNARKLFSEKQSKAGAPRLSLVCWRCGELARLKAIEDFPFTKGITEASYKCLKCGTETRHALQSARRTPQKPMELPRAGWLG